MSQTTAEGWIGSMPVAIAITGVDETTGIPERLPVFAEPTGTPGLFLTRTTAEFPFDDACGWTVTHGPSGRVLPVIPRVGVDITLARRIAETLSKVGVDWSAGEEAVTAALADPEVAARVKDTIRAALAGHRETEARDV